MIFFCWVFRQLFNIPGRRHVITKRNYVLELTRARISMDKIHKETKIPMRRLDKYAEGAPIEQRDYEPLRNMNRRIAYQKGIKQHQDPEISEMLRRTKFRERDK